MTCFGVKRSERERERERDKEMKERVPLLGTAGIDRKAVKPTAVL